jgi:hypothetical protein
MTKLYSPKSSPRSAPSVKTRAESPQTGGLQIDPTEPPKSSLNGENQVVGQFENVNY